MSDRERAAIVKRIRDVAGHIGAADPDWSRAMLIGLANQIEARGEEEPRLPGPTDCPDCGRPAGHGIGGRCGTCDFHWWMRQAAAHQAPCYTVPMVVLEKPEPVKGPS